ncbi:undecaprenyl-phosphate galactose phosphotransferase WbaP [Crateriforma conspicua]|uniref:UDP-glucose:undecaprenyl-phosphate glucose-1-phosphate transferase n=1 Tax=Crateriforma conspicua TaxID=2527996 RepID=A0A5C6FXM5_9PLAN|nr:undecaprenyl-phosphate galactose phosphotransferase WbaP [Crateriforma conspicua]TWU67669.1 UDP-glucose:undecaprenyl-phosphate glucose-1-phosphate transferase [Crateriforma conspicua]
MPHRSSAAGRSTTPSPGARSAAGGSSGAAAAAQRRRRLPAGIVSLEALHPPTGSTDSNLRLDAAHAVVAESDAASFSTGHDEPDSSDDLTRVGRLTVVRRFLHATVTAVPLWIADATMLLAMQWIVITVAQQWTTWDATVSLATATIATVMLYAAIGIPLGLLNVPGQNPVTELRMGIQSAGLAGLIVTYGYVFTSQPVAARVLACAAWVAVTVGLFPLARILGRGMLSRFSWWGVPALIIGDGRRAMLLHQYLQRSSSRGVRSLGILQTQPTFAVFGQDGSIRPRRPVDVLGGIGELPHLNETHAFRLAVVATENVSRRQAAAVADQVQAQVPEVILPVCEQLPSLWCETGDVGGFMSVRMRHRLRRPLPVLVKRITDVAGAAVLLVVLAPLAAMIALFIRVVSPGPVFYSHERIGKGGVRFQAWKFRTMVVDADQRLKHLLDSDPDLKLQWQADQKLRQDPRVIPVLGNFLRKSSLDELPQLWNVLWGQMSLVGPRPIVESEIEKYRGEFERYLAVRPGMTGLWQVSGRNDTTYDERVALDRFYVRNWSYWLDYYLLLRTIRTLLLREGAY